MVVTHGLWWIHMDYSGYTWIMVVTHGLWWIHMDYGGYTWIMVVTHGLWWLTPLSTTFQLYRGGQFYHRHLGPGFLFLFLFYQ